MRYNNNNIAILALLMILPAFSQAESPSGQALAFTCAGCHGTDGSSVGPSSPSIAGMDPDVFVDVMKGYREDRRNSTIMNRIAKAYTDEQLKGMAWFFAKQKLQVSSQKHDPQLAVAGEKLHNRYCNKCHEKGGAAGDSGTLAGQWMPYLRYSMADYIDGRRPYPRKMKRKVDALIEAEGADAVPALIHYYGSQQ
ncbi:MAG: c-type cytochrome [Candidatus Thiodiazotropha sp. (ex Notomyrtea botanica)]|nr:c-type cytochrome [Candidatus Thiodiazotropha sp. (ex Notomyrtea botanica)]